MDLVNVMMDDDDDDNRGCCCLILDTVANWIVLMAWKRVLNVDCDGDGDWS